MGRTCRVPFCGLKYCSRKESPFVRFHEFPSNLSLREKWIKAIRRKNFIPKDTDTVCSNHFQKADFFWNLKVLRLRPNAVPSVFPNFPKYLQPKVKRERRVIKRASPEEIALYKRTYIKSKSKDISKLSDSITDEHTEESHEVEYEVIQIEDSNNEMYRSFLPAPSTQDASTQADGLWDKIQELFKSNRQLKSELVKRNLEVKDLTSENKTLRKEIKVLKSQGTKTTKKENVSSIQKKTKIKVVKPQTEKKTDLRGYLNPRIPRSLYAPKSYNSVDNSQKMVLSVNHLNQVVVSQPQSFSVKKKETLPQVENSNPIQELPFDEHSSKDSQCLSNLISPNVHHEIQCSNAAPASKDPEEQLNVPLSVQDYTYGTPLVNSSELGENFILVPENCIIENHNGEVIIFANESDQNLMNENDV